MTRNSTIETKTTTRERALEAALRDATAMLRIYVAPSGRDGPNATTRGQALSTIRDATAALALPADPAALPCGCFNHDGGPYAPDCEAVYGEERATLAAAAPDMLAALREAHAVLSIAQSSGDDGVSPVLATIAAAIARATGKEG